jgi:hypothetical protein
VVPPLLRGGLGRLAFGRGNGCKRRDLLSDFLAFALGATCFVLGMIAHGHDYRKGLFALFAVVFIGGHGLSSFWTIS